MLGTGSTAITAYFDACRRKRNMVDYDRTHVASDTEAMEVLKRAKDFLTLTKARTAQNYPHFQNIWPSRYVPASSALHLPENTTSNDTRGEDDTSPLLLPNHLIYHRPPPPLLRARLIQICATSATS